MRSPQIEQPEDEDEDLELVPDRREEPLALLRPAPQQELEEEEREKRVTCRPRHHSQVFCERPIVLDDSPRDGERVQTAIDKHEQNDASLGDGAIHDGEQAHGCPAGVSQLLLLVLVGPNAIDFIMEPSPAGPEG
eukprot:CAMPEP_0204080160 /NCGR_PEP_ID=MMETSP0360-20130528/173556_1 /ASSEMBLY_ACC=CAM_ASM_000342 /TAXON_ID=268821 /ORGANISM="Scrippsiella Hangoei, Strain SHTV-5" /LENGTH=134 /DNA_ID=CAMNT_0051028929 /DNA_START=414 /DNA_END=815 /DNA_ORIENTATION=+